MPRFKSLPTPSRPSPRSSRPLGTTSSRVEGLLANDRAQIAETQRYHNEQKSLVQADEEHLANAKSKQSAAKNTKEYAAAQRELDMTRESLAVRQTEITKLVEAIQSKEKLLAERDGDVRTLRSTAEKDDEQAKARMAEIEWQDRRPADRSGQDRGDRAVRRAEAVRGHPHPARAWRWRRSPTAPVAAAT